MTRDHVQRIQVLPGALAASEALRWAAEQIEARAQRPCACPEQPCAVAYHRHIAETRGIVADDLNGWAAIIEAEA